MVGELNRYFIELLPDEGETVPRYREAEMRREQATSFLEKIGEWLKIHELDNKVYTMAVTALGQVQITCAPDVINHIRGKDELNIAAIRQGAMFLDNSQGRWNTAR